MSFWRQLGARAFNRAILLNLDNMAKLAAEGRHVLDLGCWDAATLDMYRPKDARVFGIEIHEQSAAEALKRDVLVTRADLNKQLPFASESFDLVTSHQVIEHLHDTDLFMSEMFRILRPRGQVIVSTENLASWHNTASLVFGWQPFSLTNVSSKAAGLGNPLANLRPDEPQPVEWQHVRVFSYRGLAELFAAHGFTRAKVRGAGYYPLPASLGRLDPRHAAFLTVRALRP
jgi:SAM-dependent methyltransferase